LPSQVDIPAGHFAHNLWNIRKNKLPVNTVKHPIIYRTSEHFCLIVTTAEKLKKNSLSFNIRYQFLDQNWLCESAILAPIFILMKVYTVDDNIEEHI
jgi:hypothetical protein